MAKKADSGGEPGVISNGNHTVNAFLAFVVGILLGNQLPGFAILFLVIGSFVLALLGVATYGAFRLVQDWSNQGKSEGHDQ